MEDLVEFALEVKDKETGEKAIRTCYAFSAKDVKEIEDYTEQFDILSVKPMTD